MNCDNIDERQVLFERLGEVPETTVENTEWLYMLQEDTRQSLAIEGHCASEEELEAVLHRGKTDLDISNYFRIAQTVYDQGLQYYRDKPLPLSNYLSCDTFIASYSGAWTIGAEHFG